MCGRFTLTSTPEELARRFGLEETPSYAPRYNVAPGQDVLAVRADAAGARGAALLRWGLVPGWAESADVGARWINARSESVATRPVFRDAFRARRCIVPGSGFYEWADRGGFRQPYWIGPADGAPLGFAGLWEHWREPSGDVLESCTILTRAADEAIAALHPRMPVILAPDRYGEWLDPRPRDSEMLSALLQPGPVTALAYHPVGTRVNRVEHDDPTCFEAVPEPPRQPSLF